MQQNKITRNKSKNFYHGDHKQFHFQRQKPNNDIFVRTKNIFKPYKNDT